MRRQLWRLAQKRSVDVACRPARARQHTANLLQQRNAVRALVSGVGVGEQLSDITQRSRAQQRVHHRMRQHIRVRMAKQPLFIRHRHTA